MSALLVVNDATASPPPRALTSQRKLDQRDALLFSTACQQAARKISFAGRTSRTGCWSSCDRSRNQFEHSAELRGLKFETRSANEEVRTLLRSEFELRVSSFNLFVRRELVGHPSPLRGFDLKAGL